MTETQEAPPRWEALVIDVHGFVLTDEDVRGWCEATDEGKTGWGIPCEDPDEVLIVTGSSRAEPQSDAPDEEVRRVPGSWMSEDRFLEQDVSTCSTGEILRYWERAQAVAAAMNAAGVE